MKKILMALAATTALAAAAAPAAAQPWRGAQVQSHLTTSYVDSLDWKINNAAQERRISWQQANSLRSQLRQVQPIAWRVQTGQASGRERQRLEQVVSRIEQAVTSYARNDRRDGRTYGYGYGRDYRR